MLGDKHIPRAYAINSTENRLRLLAGLIDSDGHLDPVSNGYKPCRWSSRRRNCPWTHFLGVWLGDGASGNCRITGQDPEIIAYLHEYAATLNMQVWAW